MSDNRYHSIKVLKCRDTGEYFVGEIKESICTEEYVKALTQSYYSGKYYMYEVNASSNKSMSDAVRMKLALEWVKEITTGKGEVQHDG